MPKLPNVSNSPSPLGLKLVIAGATFLLLLVSMGVLYFFSRNALKEQASWMWNRHWRERSRTSTISC